MWPVRPSPIRGAALLGLALLALSGCGGGKGQESSSGSTSSLPGAKVFDSAGCGGCHTLAAAKSNGTVGPNLDQLRPDQQRVELQVRNGGVGMPSFRNKLSRIEISQVAEFVSESTRSSTMGGSVAAGFKPDDTKIEDCKESDFHCFEQAFANISYKDGPKTALDKFDQDIKTPGPIERDCHRIAHAIGAGALSHFHGNVGQAFVAGRPSCTSGYYHGILERAFLGVDQSKLGQAARKFCSDPKIRTSEFIAYQCVHGLGHGLMIYTGYDLPVALHTCDRLRTPWDQVSCTGGVFMENQSSSYGFKSQWLRPKQPLYPCTAVSRRHKLYCYLMVTSQILPDVGYSWTKTVGVCRRSEAGWVPTGFQSLGRDASGQTRGQVGKIERICRLAGDMERECLLGAAKDLTSNDANGRRAAHLCSASPDAARAYCFYGVGAILGTFTADPGQRAADCRALTRERACVAGANGRPFPA